MIIELFGPPTVGKTTFARALAAQFMRQGRPVQLMLSLRPTERAVPGDDSASRPHRWSAVRRVVRPTFELVSCVGQMRRGATEASLAAQLLEVLPLSSVAWSVRMSQYIKRLEHSWRLARQTDVAVIFDQGFVQCVCSLVLLSPLAPPHSIEKVMALIPKADQWISIAAPAALLRARLHARRARQSWLENRFELDVPTSLRSIEILSMLESMLQRYGPCVIRVAAGAEGVSDAIRIDGPCGVPAGTEGLGRQPMP